MIPADDAANTLGERQSRTACLEEEVRVLGTCLTLTSAVFPSHFVPRALYEEAQAEIALVIDPRRVNQEFFEAMSPYKTR
jgi:hypothetical protein